MYHPATTQDDSELVAELFRVSAAKKKLIKSSTYAAPADPNITIRSWKMDEFKYYDVPSPFPTLARGIFTTKPSPKSEGPKGPEHRIVIRGYDKFFNIGEVPWTEWDTIERETAAPYVLSLKSNGCIIFIGALSPTQLLVTSKHSLGPLEGKTLTHAQAGEQWLRKYLDAKGKSEADLAGVLWEKNLTAIAELCDDNFEEHVLPYPPERTGLHLHGLNECTRQFKTLPQSQVDKFAQEWGFITTLSTTVDSIPEVRKFMEAAAENGEWEGQPVEGFVVRTTVTHPEFAVSKRGKAGKSPYKTGDSFFFKVKFDEPYMMYRDWREVTKVLLKTYNSGPQGKGGVMSPDNVSKAKMKRPETQLYVKWVIEDIKANPHLYAQFGEGKGIIRARERFLKWRDSAEGSKGLGQVEAQAEPSDTTPAAEGQKRFGKTVIVPVAIPGCGKTTVAVALTKLFGFGHTQSDDFTGKRNATMFVQNVTKLLKTNDVVIADKNNHLKQHRAALREATSKLTPPVRLLALHWALDKPNATIHNVCSDRITLRGANHQSLVPDSNKSHDDVLWRFITGTEELADSEVDTVVDMDLTESIEQALARAVDACVQVLGLERPSDEQVHEALALSLQYTPKTVKKEVTEVKKPKPPRYFGFLPELDLQQFVESAMEKHNTEAEVWTTIRTASRVTQRPHVTVVHSKNLPREKEMWEACQTLDAIAIAPSFELVLGSLVWDNRVMAVTVDEVRAAEGDKKARKFLDGVSDDLKNVFHITVGTRKQDIAPIEARDMVDLWRKGKTTDIHSLKLDDAVVKARLRGLYQ